MSSRIPILLYHDLDSPDCPNEKANPASKDTVVFGIDFERQMKHLVQNGYETLTLREYFSIKRETKPISAPKIIITFDDGHCSNYRVAFPILQKYGLRASFFVVAGRVDSPHHLTRHQIGEMAGGGMELCSHGLTHDFLPLLGRASLERELYESRSILETISGRAVEYFAFPGGHYDRNVLTLLPSAGYKGACSCIQGLNGPETDPYLLRRIEVRRRLSMYDFEHLFDPDRIAFYRFIDLCKGFLRSSMGLRAYSAARSRLYKFYLFGR